MGPLFIVHDKDEDAVASLLCRGEMGKLAAHCPELVSWDVIDTDSKKNRLKKAHDYRILSCIMRTLLLKFLKEK